MSLEDKIDDWITAAETRIPQQGRTRKVRLYGKGVISKLKQSQYALDRLEQFSEQSDHLITSTDPDTSTIADRVGFYCDTYWAFLYSALDILAQVVNQAMKLGFDEKTVSFKDVDQKLQGKKYKNGALQKAVSACRKSVAYRNLDKYRNCSTHRRQIYIEESMIMAVTTGTPGYQTTTTGQTRLVSRLICDDPLVVNPKLDQKREVPGYLDTVHKKICAHIENIFDALDPIN